MKIHKKSFILSCLFVFLFSLNSLACKIAIYGDSQHNPKIQEKLVQQIISLKPDIVFRVGDLVDDGTDPRLWEIFNSIHGPLMNISEYFPALGNHERNSPLYFQNFPQINNQHWYMVKRCGIYFIILDSNSAFIQDSPQYRWLKSQLEKIKSESKFIILIFHHPLFDVGSSHHDDEKNLRPVLLPLIKQYNIKAVFCGHSHNYQRFKYLNTYFIVTGGGGSYLVKQSRNSPYLQKFLATFHFCLLTPQKEALEVKVIDLEGNIIDKFVVYPK